MKNKLPINLGRWSLFATLIFNCLIASAQKHSDNEQESDKMKSILRADGKKDWHNFKEDVGFDPQNPEAFFEKHKEAFGLRKGFRMKLIKKREEKELKTTHYEFQQFYNEVPVLWAVYKLHKREGHLLKGNGKIVRDFTNNEKPALSPEAAVKAVLNQVNARKYGWQDEKLEAIVKKKEKDYQATLRPQAKLVYCPTGDGKDPIYEMAYSIKILALEPEESHKQYYVSARTGKVIRTIDLIHETNTPATATTLYNGVQNITTSNAGSNYILKADKNGTIISTYDMNSGTNVSQAVDYQNATTNWQSEPVGTQGHWSSEKTYEYFKNVHGRNSFDNNASEIIGYFDYGVNYNNASWNGMYMKFGGGDGINKTSWGSLDVVGHELTHAVTEYSAGLVYLNESGALNESFSDIFGTAVEFYAQGGTGDWLMSEDVTINGEGIRSMENPNLHGDPDTYQGTNWVFGTTDNGGVHTNSGVQNHWFYLLSQGGNGTNDLGNAFTVTGIGMNKAAQIAYRNLTVYLTASSNYLDARNGALEAAKDIFGVSSVEYAQTAMAWYAVGVGYPVYTGEDLSIKTLSISGQSCNQLSLELINASIATTIPAGAVIQVIVKENGVAKPEEQIVLSAPIAPGSTLLQALAQPILSTSGKFDIDVQVNYQQDSEPRNNIFSGRVFKGIMTIGGIAPDFSSLHTAIEALRGKNILICGSLDFRIRTGYYDLGLGGVEIANIQLPDNGILTIQSETGNADDVVLYSYTPYEVVDGTINIQNVNVSLRNLTIIRSSNQLTSTVISVNGELSNLIIEGNIIKNAEIGYARFNIAISPFGNGLQNVTIRNNHFNGGTHGVQALGENLIGDIRIENNDFNGSYQYAINLYSANYAAVQKNKIYSDNGREAIIVSALNASIEGNEINFDNLNYDNYPISGIIITNKPSGVFRVIDNVINLNAAGHKILTAISVSGARGEILHNTMKAESPTNSGYDWKLISVANASENIVNNNIFYSNANATCLNLSMEGVQHTINHNDFYVPVGNVGKLNGFSYKTLSAWRSATGYDLNSITVQPLFISTSDLHLANEQLALKIGSINNVQYDIDEELRHSPPYLGADEYYSTSTPFVTLSPDSIQNIPSEGRSYYVNVTSNSNWDVVTPLPNGITVDQVIQQQGFRVTVGPNSECCNPKEFLLQVKTTKSPTGIATLYLQQNPAAPTITLSPNIVNDISAEGVIGSVAVASNTTWEVLPLPGVSVSNITSLGFMYEVYPNPQSTPRSFELIVQTTSGSPVTTATLTLNQKGRPYLNILPTSISGIPVNGKSYLVNVSSNSSWVIETPLPNGVTVDQETAESFRVNIDTNPSNTIREFSVKIKTLDLPVATNSLNLKQDGTPTLAISPTAVTIVPEGQSGFVTVNSNTGWTVLTPPSGVTVSTSATGFTYTVSPNPTPIYRYLTLTVETTYGSPKITQTLTLTQSPPTLSVPVNTIYLASGGVEGSISISSNTTWDIGPTPSWFEVISRTSTGFNYRALPNSESTARYFSLNIFTIPGAVISKTVSFQQFAPYVIINPETVNYISSEGQTGTVSVNSNGPWTVETPAEVTIESETANSFVYRVSQNTSYTPKTFNVIVKTTSPQVYKTLTLNQNPAYYINATPEVVDNIPAQGQSGVISVASNVSYWYVQATSEMGVSNQTSTGFTYYVSQNISSQPRTLTLTIKSGSGTASKTVTFNQLGSASAFSSTNVENGDALDRNTYLKISPNPIENGTINLSGYVNTKGSYRVDIHDLYGLLKQSEELSLENGKIEKAIIVNIPPGFYVVQIFDPQGGIVELFKIQKK